MLFNSIQFLIFFVIITFIYFLIEHKYRWLLLLASSCYFYMAFVPIYIAILGFTIVIDYWAGIYIEKSKGNKRRTLLVISLVANIGILAVFKYYNFFYDNLALVLEQYDLKVLLPRFSLLLPIGLSFHTFQAMSYTIEVYRGNQKAERHFGIYSLYVMFYPQLVAGPIERPQNILHQFYEKKTFNYDRITYGLKLMAWGLFKKVVIADRLALIVDNIFNNYQSHSGLMLLIGAIFFSFQIFCDFSGYSDMALGIAEVMGFKLMKNFNMPYHAKSIKEFWSKWHISLSTWFRDYLYIPLGGNRVSKNRMYFNLIFVFLLSGFWHGASWSFIVWGGLHGVFLVCEQVLNNFRAKYLRKTDDGHFARFAQILTTFFLVTFAWIFFRANTLHEAFNICKKIAPYIYVSIYSIFSGQYIDFIWTVPQRDILVGFLVIGILETVHLIQTRVNILNYLKDKPRVLRWSIYYLVVLAIAFMGVYNERQFIYFQF